MATMLGLQKYNTGGLVNWWETKEKVQQEFKKIAETKRK